MEDVQIAPETQPENCTTSTTEDPKLAARIAALKTLQPGDILVMESEGGCRNVAFVESTDDYGVNFKTDILFGVDGDLASLNIGRGFSFEYIAGDHSAVRILRNGEGAL